MIGLLLLALVHLHFTAPADGIAPAAAGGAVANRHPVRAYVFYQLDARGAPVPIPGYADSTLRTLLTPHAVGTRESVWLAPVEHGASSTIFVLSRGSDGQLSAPSNGCIIGSTTVGAPRVTVRAGLMALPVPVVRRTRERCGEAALSMVLRYYGADAVALREVDGAFDPVLHGSLITDLAGAARRAGYDASVATLTPDSLIDLLDAGVPPILLYQNGTGPLTVRHFGVVTGWDAANASFTLLDGGPRPRVTRREELAKRWENAGSQALIVRQVRP